MIINWFVFVIWACLVCVTVVNSWGIGPTWKGFLWVFNGVFEGKKNILLRRGRGKMSWGWRGEITDLIEDRLLISWGCFLFSFGPKNGEKTNIPFIFLVQITEIRNLTEKINGRCNRYKKIHEWSNKYSRKHQWCSREN